MTAPAGATSGNLVVTDAASNTVTVPITVNAALAVSPTTKTLMVNDTLSISSTGGVAPITYAKTSGNGTLSGTTFTAPGTSGSTVITATDNIGNTATCTVTVNAALTMTTPSKTLAVGNQFTFASTGGVTPIVYSVNAGGAGGTINSATGYYTAPASVGSGSDTITATDALNHTATSTATIVAALTISPTSKTIPINDMIAFTSTGGGGTNVFSVFSGVGSIGSSTGFYTAPATTGSSVARVTDTLGNIASSNITVTTLTTSNDYQYGASLNSAANGVCVAGSSGNIFAVGYGVDATTSTQSWIVRKSTDSGATWSVVDTYQYTANQTASAYGCATNSTGTTIYVVGYGVDGSAVKHWVVRSSTDSGSTWATSDNYNNTAGYNAAASAVTVKSNGDVIVVGYGFNNTPRGLGVTRKLSGGTWSTLETYNSFSTSYDSYPTSVVVDPSGYIYVTSYSASSNSGTLKVRRSIDGGTTWTTIAAYGSNIAIPGGLWIYNGILTLDSSGNLYISDGAGDQSINSTTSKILVHKSTDQGNTWSYVDSSDYGAGGTWTAPKANFYDNSTNNIYTVGQAPNAGGVVNWFVRKWINNTSTNVIIDLYQLDTTHTSSANGVVVNTISGVSTLIVVGQGVDSTGVSHWITRTIGL